MSAAARADARASSALLRGARRLPIHATIVVLVVLWSIPTIGLLVSSFRDPQAIAASGWWEALVHPDQLTLDNYETVLGRRGMGRSFVNSVIITLPSTALVTLVAAFAAYAIAWMDFPGRRILFTAMVGLLVVPLQTTLIPVLRLISRLTVDQDLPLLGGNLFGVNSYVTIWLAHAAYGLPFAIFLLRNFFASLPADLLEAARLDGATDWQVFSRIVLPLSLPALAALGIFQFLWTWNDLLIALIILGDPDLAPMTLRITNLVSSFGTSYQLLTAAAFVSMAAPLVIFFAFQRFFVEGVLAGAVKG